MGEFINGFFESLMNWKLDSAIVDLSGRDMAVFFLGFLVCGMICMVCEGKEIKIGKSDRRSKK